MATTQVILKEKVNKLGAEGDLVKVRAGFARNFLLPQGKAFAATKSNMANLEALKKARAIREAAELDAFEKLAVKLRRLKLKLTLATGQGGKAFGSITALDILKAVAESPAQAQLDKHQIVLDKPIKSTGKFEILVKLHEQVECTINLTVLSEGAKEEKDEEAVEKGE
ncbi:MAG: 50S ribosomal protein L9 [Verrucomicrobia bacterium]|nr:50S ribosomal protein L9 [Verrucomicrobiota bacterium]